MVDNPALAFVVGFLSATFIGLIFGRMRLAWKQAGSPGRVQKVEQAAKKTPLQVLADGFKALIRLVVWGMLLIVVVGIVYLFFTGQVPF